MSPEAVSRTISLIIAPAVMISACAILLGGLLSRYSSINDRLRSMVRERLDLLSAVDEADLGPVARTRLDLLNYQVPDLMRRHRQEHNAIVTTYLSILVFILSMLILGIAATTSLDLVASAALFVFLFGTILLSFAVVLIIGEVRNSLVAVSYEVTQVFHLKDKPPPKS